MGDELKNKKILVVDDEVDLREIIADELTLLGAEVSQAANGRDAFELYVKLRHHAIISDLRMPGGDGVELLRRLQERARHHHAEAPQIFLITGFADLTAQEARELGARYLLPKPFSLRHLRKLVIAGLNGGVVPEEPVP